MFYLEPWSFPLELGCPSKESAVFFFSLIFGNKRTGLDPDTHNWFSFWPKLEVENSPKKGKGVPIPE